MGSTDGLSTWQHRQQRDEDEIAREEGKQEDEVEQEEEEEELQRDGVVVVVSRGGEDALRQMKADPLKQRKDTRGDRHGDTDKNGDGRGHEDRHDAETSSDQHAGSSTGDLYSFRRRLCAHLHIEPHDVSEARGREAGWSGNGGRVRGFHDMICVGFAISLCLNLGSLTARKEGFFAAEVNCLPQGAAQTILPDLGMWIGWRQAVANSEQAVIFELQELSMKGAAMGILTVVGHATDAVLNAVGLAILLYSRRKPLQEAQCRLVKRLCLASLSMAGWLLGMTVIGFLVAVKGPIGNAAVAYYSNLDLDCRSSVSVSVDYAYAMTTLTVLCQFFIGVVALPTPSTSHGCRRRCRWCRWCLVLGRANGRCSPSSSSSSPCSFAHSSFATSNDQLPSRRPDISPAALVTTAAIAGRRKSRGGRVAFAEKGGAVMEPRFEDSGGAPRNCDTV